MGDILEVVDVADHQVREKARKMGAPANLESLFEEIQRGSYTGSARTGASWLPAIPTAAHSGNFSASLDASDEGRGGGPCAILRTTRQVISDPVAK